MVRTGRDPVSASWGSQPLKDLLKLGRRTNAASEHWAHRRTAQLENPKAWSHKKLDPSRGRDLSEILRDLSLYVTCYERGPMGSAAHPL